jgi:GT2 family glycosyltransferase
MAGSLAVLIATFGRAQIVADLVRSLEAQTRPPDRVICVGATPADVAEIEQGPMISTVVGRRGSAHQRNDALELGGALFDTIVFFDDDFVPSRFWLERAEQLFATFPEFACLTGNVLADGNRTAGVPCEEARAIVERRDANPFRDFSIDPGASPYGCNMAFRGSAIRDMRFDERLPLYAWLEDKDFGERVRARGAAGKAALLWGVHMGAKNGKTPGVRLGYSQVANAVYLARKGTVGVSFALRLVAGNIASNLSRSVRPEAWIDRRGRLRGNVIALADAAIGRLAPERVVEL